MKSDREIEIGQPASLQPRVSNPWRLFVTVFLIVWGVSFIIAKCIGDPREDAFFTWTLIHMVWLRFEYRKDC